MKRFGCLLLTVLILIETAGAYNGDFIVYITNSGAKYHTAGCSYLKSSNPISLEDAVSRGYTPCSKCGPPRLESYGGNRARGSFTEIAPQPTISIRVQDAAAKAALERENENLRKIAENRNRKIRELQKELSETKESLDEARRQEEAARTELLKFKHKLLVFGSCFAAACSYAYYYLICIWRKKERARIETEVRASIPPPLTMERPAMPVSSPERIEKGPPPVRMGYDLSKDNPYLKEAYRQRYEGKSISEIACVPPDVWFDEDDFPHQKNPLSGDIFTVYITKKGKSYHTADCPSGRHGRAVNICYAKWKGLGACDRCKPMRDLPKWLLEYQRISRICKAFEIDIKP